MLKPEKSNRIIIITMAVLVTILAVGVSIYRWNSMIRLQLVSPAETVQTYTLEKYTKRQRLERLLSVTLYNNGTAFLSTPPISSYRLPKSTYTVENKKLRIHAAIETNQEKDFYGVENGEVLAIFTVENKNILIFESATVAVFADKGARYVYK